LVEHRRGSKAAEYLQYSSRDLPLRRRGSGSGAFERVDRRPIHPAFYGKTDDEIKSAQRELRAEFGVASGKDLFRSRMCVFYENGVDGRNLGGLIRNANAFSVDTLFYSGRRHRNLVGAVGSNHFVECQHICGADGAAWRQQVEELCHGRCVWWFLSCGQEFLYPLAPSTADGQKEAEEFHALVSRGVVYLTLDEYTLRGLLPEDSTVVLVVPQEGKLPAADILSACEKIVCVSPLHFSLTNSPARGLPSQVASAIALQRLFSVLHPALR
jgi:hypothetical protein